MTPTQIARRSDALYADGTCGMTRRVLCDMVAQREADLEDAKAESAKLRELVSNCHGWLAVNCEKGYVIPRNGLDDIEQSMRELGIEVDG